MNIDEVIIYLRKSRSDDPSMSVSEVLVKHEKQLQDYAINTYGHSIPEDNIFREVVSGETIDNRPVIQAVLKLLESSRIKGCLVVDPQRLSRGDLEDCGRIINAFRYTNTLVVTPPKTYDLSDEYDRKFFEMELMRGNDYLEYTKKILNRGRIASVKNGNFIGSVAPYGYSKVKKGSGKDTYYTLDIIPEEAEAVKLMYHLFIDEGYGFTRIAKHLDSLGIKPRKSECWSPAAIKDMVENPVYIGKIRWNWRKTEKIISDGKIVKTRPKTKNESDWIYVDGRHEAIVDESIYHAALDRRGKNPRIRKGTTLNNPFAGLLFCGTCGRAMSFKSYTRPSGENTITTNIMLCSAQSWCKTRSVQYNSLVNYVLRILRDAVSDFELKLKSQEQSNEEIHRNIITGLENDLKKLKDKDSRQKDAYEDGIYTKEEYTFRNAKLQEQIEEVRAAIINARQSIPEVIDYREKISRFNNCINSLTDPGCPASKKNVILKSCVEKITYHNHMESRRGIGRYVENEFTLDVVLNI